jgi:hypothetical protein
VTTSFACAFLSPLLRIARGVSARRRLASGMSANPQLLEALMAVAGERNGDINTRRLGRYLTRNVRRIESGMRIENAGNDLVTCRPQYKVTSVTSVISVSANPSREICI